MDLSLTIFMGCDIKRLSFETSLEVEDIFHIICHACDYRRCNIVELDYWKYFKGIFKVKYDGQNTFDYVTEILNLYTNGNDYK